jgi:hypothetical protein
MRSSLPTHHIYRGTSVGWAGSDAIQQLGVTCTSSDPLVATLFAINCQRYAEGVVQVARFEQVNGICANSNVLSHLECEITIAVSPAEFQRLYVAKTVSALVASTALRELGFSVPTRIYSITHLRELIKETQQNRQRLSVGQIEEFDRRVLA